MKVNGTGQVGPTSGSSRKKKTSAGGFDELLGSDSAAAASLSATTGTAPLAAVGGLFALQEAPDATTGRSKGVARAEDMLKQLDELRRGLVLGRISVNDLKSLAYSIRQQRALTADPRLNDILSEIELRAEVELAKLGF